MSEKKRKPAGAKAGKSTSREAKSRKKKEPSVGTTSAGGNAEKIRPERTDQIGAIVTKGFSLAEAGINLGLNLINKIGSVAQDQFVEKIVDLGKNIVPSQGMPREEPGGEAPPAYENREEQGRESEPASRTMYVENRLPLFPGSPVHVSFSISNDSPSAPKKIALGIEGFTGEMRGAQIDGSNFSVKPAKKSIAPLDFDKFVLSGTIPPGVVSDAYLGWIVVTGDEQLKIPVRLTVTAES